MKSRIEGGSYNMEKSKEKEKSRGEGYECRDLYDL
jgi:hypothetical protein